jgi:hypothetical protein
MDGHGLAIRSSSARTSARDTRGTLGRVGAGRGRGGGAGTTGGGTAGGGTAGGGVAPVSGGPVGRVGALTAVQFVGATRGWAVGPGAILATGDGGRTWRPQRLSVGTTAAEGLVAGTGGQAYALTFVRGGQGPVQQRQLFATATGGDAGTATRLTLTTPTPRLSRKALRRAGGRVSIRGTLAGAQGGEQIVVSRRAAAGARWFHQVVTAGANGGSFTATFRITRSSFFVAQWAGDSGRAGAGTRVLGVSVR